MTSKQYPGLFEIGENWRMNARLNFMCDMSTGYIEGYLRAADRLVQHVADTAEDQDFFVYPIAFMYRQHIELQLKQIIDTGRRLLTNEGGQPVHHKLHDLWSSAKGVLRQIWNSKPDPPEFELIDNFIDQFSRVDAGSTAFRYPTQRDGNSSLQGVHHINLRNLADCVHSFSGFLDGIASELDEIWTAE